MAQGLPPGDVVNIDALPAIPLPVELTDLLVFYRIGLPDPAYQGSAAELIALATQNIQTQTIVASENISNGALVNVWNNGGIPTVRNATGAVHGKPAHGYATSAVLAGDNLTIAFFGVVPAPYGGLNPGPVFLSALIGQATSTPLTGIGTQTSQQVGVCCDATGLSFVFQPQSAVNL